MGVKEFPLFFFSFFYGALREGGTAKGGEDPNLRKTISPPCCGPSSARRRVTFHAASTPPWKTIKTGGRDKLTRVSREFLSYFFV